MGKGEEANGGSFAVRRGSHIRNAPRRQMEAMMKGGTCVRTSNTTRRREATVCRLHQPRDAHGIELS